MRRATATHAIPCDPETFWNAFWDDAYNRALYLETMGFKELAVLEKSETQRRMRIVPKMNLPGPVAKLLGDRFGYEEVGTLDRAKNEFRWKMLPNTMADRLSTEGSVRIEPAGAGKFQRVDNFAIEAKVFGIGSMIEQSAEKEVRAAWETESAFLTRWLGRK
jgi:hypothetical protein